MKIYNRNAIAKCGSEVYINIQRTRETEDIRIDFSPELRIEMMKDSHDTAVLAYGPYILAALSEKETFLEFDLKGMGPEMGLSAELLDEERLVFRTGKEEGLIWMPLSQIGKEKHHVYWKMK